MAETMLHIASAIVKARPVMQNAVEQGIAALGADVVAAERGRIIVVLEAEEHYAIATTLNRIVELDGVLSATLVFEHSEPWGEAA